MDIALFIDDLQKPQCLTDISLGNIKRCRKLVNTIKKDTTESYCTNGDMTDRCLAVLEEMKKLGQDVSILSPRFHGLSTNDIVISYI